jgi:polar amino acid transport system ATP-binding protein
LSVSRWAGAATLGLFLDAFRSIPLIIQLILFFNFFPIIGFPLNPFAAGTFVLVLYTSALVAAVARGGIEAVPVTTRRAGRSLGLTYWQDMRYIVWPIGLRAVLPAWAGVALGVLKDSALVSVLGYVEPGLGARLCRAVTRLADPDHPDPGAVRDSDGRGPVLLRPVVPHLPGDGAARAQVAAMIEVKDVHKAFGDLQVLKGVTLDVSNGEVISVIGASGSGKSTLLYCINGLEPIQSGQILVDGTDVHAKDTNVNKLRTGLGMVFQQYNSFPHLTTLENVALAPRIVLKKSKDEAREIASKKLDHVGLGDKLEVYPNKLSGGQQQRLAIARALAMGPNYMLFDEVTSALDPELVGEVLDALRMLSDEGMTMILVTHEIGFARDVSDRVAYFHEGVIEEIGPPSQVILDPQSERTRKFLSAVR